MFNGYFSSSLRRAPDRSATFLTDLAGRTVKKSTSPEGPGFESRQPQQKCHRSIAFDYLTFTRMPTMHITKVHFLYRVPFLTG